DVDGALQLFVGQRGSVRCVEPDHASVDAPVERVLTAEQPDDDVGPEFRDLFGPTLPPARKAMRVDATPFGEPPFTDVARNPTTGNARVPEHVAACPQR